MNKAQQAKVSENQIYCDELAALSEKFRKTSKDNLCFTLDKARKSILVHPHKLVSKKEFLALKGVGDYVARILSKVAEKQHPSENDLVSSSNPSEEEEANSRSSIEEINSTQVTKPVRAPPRPVKKSKPNNTQEEEEEDSDAEIPITPEARLVLLVDSREKGSLKTSCHFFENELRSCGIEVEVLGLPLGDMLWAVRQGAHLYICCDTIVERKTIVDLAISITDGRYHEQKSRLLDSGLNQPIYLVEGPVQSAGVNIAAINTAIINTRLSGFLVVQTEDKHSSCRFLAGVHSQLQKRMGTFTLTKKNRYDAFSVRSRMKRLETVCEVFQAMLLQIPGSSADKVRAIVSKYPTPSHLMMAYRKCENATCREQLVEEIVFGAGRRKIGPAFSKTMSQVFNEN